MSQSNVEIARRGFEAVMRRDLNAIGELLDPEIRWHGGDPSAEGACGAPAAATRWASLST